MPGEFTLTRTVEFHETDMAGIVHYSNFFRYMESAEHAFFRSIGESVAGRSRDPRIGWPRVHASCDYHRPLRFEDRVEIRLRLAEKRSKSLGYEFRFRKLEEAGAVEVARGRLTVVCVTHQADGTMKATAIPEDLASKLEVVPDSPEPDDSVGEAEGTKKTKRS